MSDIIEAATRAQALLPRLDQIADTAHEAAQLIRELLKLHIPPDFYTPMIEAAALERAAKVAEDHDVSRIDAYRTRNEITAAIRAMKPAESSAA